MASVFDAAEEAALRAADDALFDRMDANGDGVLSLSEVESGLRQARLPTSHRHVVALFTAMDADGNGSVERHEFHAFLVGRREQLRRAFDSIATTRPHPAMALPRRYITGSALRTAAASCGVELSDADIRKMMKRMDVTGDGVVSFEEFVECLLLAPTIDPAAYFDRRLVECFVDDPEMILYGVRPRPSASDAAAAATPDDAKPVPTFAAVVVKKLVCGAFAGGFSRTLTAPVDRVRLLMMTSKEPLSILGAFRLAVSHPTMGWRALWIGNGVNCAKITPEMSIKLLIFDVLRQHIAADPDNVSTLERLAAGGVAGAVSQGGIYPMEVVRTRLATADPGTYRGIAHCFKEVHRIGGVPALYAGIGPSLAGIIPYAAIDLSLMSILKEAAAAHLSARERDVSVPLLLTCGMVSSAVATVATFPLNVIRTRMQATNADVRTVVREVGSEGLRGYYRGLIPCMAKVMPATSLSYTVYEYLGAQWKRRLE